MKKLPILYIVMPCYNEEEVLNETIKRISLKMKDLIVCNEINSKSKILFVDDGSTDNTWQIILNSVKKNKLIAAIKLSKNKGHQNALYAGLMVAKEKSDVVISMDADLQDDIDTVNEMLKLYKKGNELVYGVRKSRDQDSIFKKNTALLFYKIMKYLGVDIIYNHADYRLTSKKVLDRLEEFKEINLFLRGMFPLIGYKNTIVYYDRGQRYAGKTKYPLRKMLALAWNGITSFSIKPIRIILNGGIFLLIGSLITIICLLILNKINNTNLIIMIMFNLTGVILMALGVVGEYVGKIHEEVKNRPKYFIEEYLNND